MIAIQIIGRAKGAIIVPGGSLCAVCGPSPFGVGRPTKKVLGPLFTDYDALADGSCPDVCEGCAAVLGGKPSKTDPPVRMGHIAVQRGVLLRPSGAELCALLREPDGVEVIGWTRTRQKHVSLRCGPCSPGRLIVGTEGEPVEWIPSLHVAVLDAVAELREGATRAQILSGDYPPHVIDRIGGRWSALESTLRPYRPSTLLEMVVGIVPKPETKREPEPMAIDPTLHRAATLLLEVALGSDDRISGPIRFWSDLLLRRLNAAAAKRDLIDAVGALMEGVQCSPLSPGGARAVILADEEPTPDLILRAWRETPRLVVTLARNIYAARKAS